MDALQGVKRDLPMATIEEQYNAANDAMSPRERIARSLAMFQWAREFAAREIQKKRIEQTGEPYSAEELKWQVALRIYGSEPAVVALIRRSMDDVSA